MEIPDLIILINLIIYSPRSNSWLTFYNSCSTACKLKNLEFPCCARTLRTQSLPNMLLHNKNTVGEKSETMSHLWYREPVTQKITQTSFITVRPLVPFNIIIIYLCYLSTLFKASDYFVHWVTFILSVRVFQNNPRLKLWVKVNDKQNFDRSSIIFKLNVFIVKNRVQMTKEQLKCGLLLPIISTI